MKTQGQKNQILLIKPKQKGFSLIELLIVVVIIGIVAAIAVPNLLRSRMAANEGSAISSVRNVHSAQISYKATQGAGEYTDLPTLYTQAFVDEVIGVAPHTKSGYVFQVDVLPSSSSIDARFNLRGRPAVHTLTSSFGGTGSRDFGTTESGELFETLDNTPVTFDNITRDAQGTAVSINR